GQLQGNLPAEQGIVYEIPRPETSRLAEEPERPLETTSLHPPRSLTFQPRVKVKRGAHPDQRGRVQAADVRRHPSFLFWRAQADPYDVGTGGVDPGNQRVIFSVRERPERRR